MDLPTMRARVRNDLHDEDSANYRWTDGELDRHIQRAVRDFSLAYPLEAKTALAATPGSRDISISGADGPRRDRGRRAAGRASTRRRTCGSPSG